MHKIWTITIDNPGRLSICQSVCHAAARGFLCKHGSMDRGPAFVRNSWKSKNISLESDGSPDFLHRFDAAFA